MMVFDSTSVAILCGLLGICIGSFLNVVIFRLPKMMENEWQSQLLEFKGDTPSQPSPPYNLATPRSRCPSCSRTIGWQDNIPLVSYFLILRGKCRHCGTRISLRYPLIEALTGIATAFTVWHFGPTQQAVAAVLLLWALLTLTFIDLDTQLLPDSITLPLLWLGLLFNLEASFTDLHSAVIGAMAGYLVLWSVFWLFKLATGKEGMGYGDFKLLAALGAWLGWQMLPAIILLSSVVGAVIGILLMIFARHGRNVPIPFGPYLAIAGLIALFWGKTLNESYLGLIY